MVTDSGSGMIVLTAQKCWRVVSKAGHCWVEPAGHGACMKLTRLSPKCLSSVVLVDPDLITSGQKPSHREGESQIPAPR